MAFDPLAAWVKMASAGWDLTRVPQRIGETMSAANEVIAKRATLIHEDEYNAALTRWAPGGCYFG